MKSLKHLEQAIANKQLAPCYLISGDEPAIIDQAVAMLAAVVPKGEQALNLSRWEGTLANVDALLADLAAPSFFGSQRVIVVNVPLFLTGQAKLTEAQQTALLSYLGNPPAENTLVIVARDLALDKRKKITKTLLKAATPVTCDRLSEQQAKQAIAAAIVRQQATITPDALHLFLHRTQANYSVMRRELPKLLLADITARQITPVVVADLVPKSFQASVFDLVSAVLAGQRREAVTCFRELVLYGEPPLKIVAVLSGQWRLLLQVMGSQLGERELAQQLKVHPYRIKLARQLMRQHAARRVCQNYRALITLETQLKSVSIDVMAAVEHYLLFVTQSAQREIDVIN